MLSKEKHPSILRKNLNEGIFLEPLDNQHHPALFWTFLSTRKKSFTDRGFSYAVAKYWNDLPECIKKAKDIKHFKSLLKTHFFTLAFPTQ